MRIFRTKHALRQFLSEKKSEALSIGFVPTMGALHAGHLSLIAASQRENKVTVCSIYVNPIQFNDSKDFKSYPRTESEDIVLLDREKCDVLFLPEPKEMNVPKNKLAFRFDGLDQIMEGKYRPNHFSGVALVVAQLFNIVMPDVVYFGQKDYQQYKIIYVLRDVLQFPISLRCVTTVREDSGLAFSSRNQRLNARQKETAVLFIQSLRLAQRAIKEGEKLTAIRKEVLDLFAKEKEARIEYIEFADCETLMPFEDIADPKQVIILIAGYVDNVRLIDNVLVRDIM